MRLVTGLKLHSRGSISAIGDIGNVSSNAPSAGQVLKWSGTEWAPASDQGGGGGSGISLTDLSVSVGTAGTANLAYNSATGVFDYTPPDLSSFLTTVAFSDLTGTPTTIAGYGITDAF